VGCVGYGDDVVRPETHAAWVRRQFLKNEICADGGVRLAVERVLGRRDTSGRTRWYRDDLLAAMGGINQKGCGPNDRRLMSIATRRHGRSDAIVVAVGRRAGKLAGMPWAGAPASPTPMSWLPQKFGVANGGATER